MDDLRFDRLARVLGQARSRREGLKAALGSLLGLGAAGAALDGGMEADALRRDRRRGDAAGADGDRRSRKKGCTPPCATGFTCVKTGRKRKKRFTCQCLSGVTCGEACCAEGETCDSGACTVGPAPVQCHPMGEFCKQTGRPCCDGLTCGSGQGGQGDIGCWVAKGGACASTADCTWGTECRDGVCGPLLCGPGNCDGCCTATAHGICIGGRDQSDGQCGGGGVVCAACPPGKVCRQRRCRCAAGTKPCGDGCIPDAACCTDGAPGCPVNESCRVSGVGNGRCECGETGVSCPPSGQACTAPDASGVCTCGNGGCRPDQVCTGGVCGCGPGAVEVSGACQCQGGFVACGNACIPVSAGDTGCCENGVVVRPGDLCPTTGICNGATGACECGETPPVVCGQNSFCDLAGACRCRDGRSACGSSTPPVCCESFETCLDGTCITTSALCGGRLCAAGQGCCGGVCTNLTNWGQTQVAQFRTTCMSPTPQGCTDAVLSPPQDPSNPTANNGAATIPFYVYVSPDGLTAWVAEHVNERVSVWTRPTETSVDWTPQTTFGSGPGSGPQQFNWPYSVVASFDGLTAFVADSENNRISVWRRSSPTSLTWVWQANFGGGCSAFGSCAADQLWKPGAVAVSSDTLTAWATDTGSVTGSNGRIQVWTRPDAASTAWTHQGNIGSYGTGADQFRRPRGIFVSPDERTMWIADDLNHRVAVYTFQGGGPSDWTQQTTFGSCTGNPLPATCQGAGICDGASQLNRPLGVVASLDGTVAYVADYCNDRISIWSRSSATATDWAPVTRFGYETGTPAVPTRTNTTAGFDQPRGVWVAGDACTAWVADTLNQRISIWKGGN